MGKLFSKTPKVTQIDPPNTTSTELIELEELTTNVNTAKKALLIGINYFNTENVLSGCINDSNNIKRFLLKHNYFRESEITMMNDYQYDDRYPVKKNILKQFKNLVRFANRHKDKQVCLFISYSGHGYFVEDSNSDESDGYDEALCPIILTLTGSSPMTPSKRYWLIS